jgi:hypothetical protein
MHATPFRLVQHRQPGLPAARPLADFQNKANPIAASPGAEWAIFQNKPTCVSIPQRQIAHLTSTKATEWRSEEMPSTG